MGLFSSPTPYRGQKYGQLKKEAKDKGQLFIDREFPPDDSSVFYTKGKMAGVEWKRPKQICANPKLFVEGTSSGDVSQGRLGNCWFVAASSCLAQIKEIWQKVIPDHNGQEWDENKPDEYQGIFHFNFWRYGEWVDVVIDDFLPTVNGELIFIHSQQKNEFWSALLEKAYAKLFGCYESLDGGGLEEALVDFTGGIAEPIDMISGGYLGDEAKRIELFAMMDKEMDRRSLMAAAIPATSSQDMEQKLDSGLVKGHAYGITAVKKVPLDGTGLFNMFKQEKIKMVRLRNPWGEVEWRGAFSDGSPEWEKISKADREKIGLTFEDDGEFWMTFEDFCKHFSNMAICRVVNTSFFSLRKTWSEASFHGEWKPPLMAGGCLNNRDMFLKNPQYGFEISDNEDEILVALTQKSGRGHDNAEKMTMGFSLMKVEENRRYICHKLQDIVKSSTFKNSRSIFLRHTLKKGRYVAIPCTFDSGLTGQFLLRVFTSSSNEGQFFTHHHPVPGLLSFMWKDPKIVSIIKVIRADGLEHQDKEGGADPYCVVSCEGEKVTTPTISDTLNPQWDCSVIFFRKQPIKSPIKVQIWNKNVIKDEYMGKAVFTATEPCENKRQEVELMGRKREGNVKRPGKLFVEITTSTDIDAL